jgi:hypothetical protein
MDEYSETNSTRPFVGHSFYDDNDSESDKEKEESHDSSEPPPPCAKENNKVDEAPKTTAKSKTRPI